MNLASRERSDIQAGMSEISIKSDLTLSLFGV